MSRNGRVVVAMSGGVDSSVAACLLKEQGYECVGVFMRVGAKASEADEVCAVAPGEGASAVELSTHPQPLPEREGGNSPSPRRLRHGCCSATDAADARAVAGRLGIPFYALNFEREFERIMDYFVDEYRQARTPNPCVMCNIHVKFGRLLRYTDAMDAEFVATGHYARVVRRDERAFLARSTNVAKDQSYLLFGIRRDDLARCMFPVGEMPKPRVREIAAGLGLAVHDKPDSQEICFVPGNDHVAFLHGRAPETLRPGEFRDATGRVIGTHDGVASFTIGQRRGLRLAVGTPIYVTALNAASNTVSVGPREELLHAGLVADGINWHVEPPAPTMPTMIPPVTSTMMPLATRTAIPRETPTAIPPVMSTTISTPSTIRVRIKIRHMHTPAAGTIEILPDGAVRAVFDEPQLAVTPGQAAVFYDADDVVIGGGWIREAVRGQRSTAY